MKIHDVRFEHYLEAANGTMADCMTRLFGTTRVPLESSVPRFANLPERVNARIYRVDVDRLNTRQFYRLTMHLVHTRGLKFAQARERLLFEGYEFVDG